MMRLTGRTVDRADSALGGFGSSPLLGKNLLVDVLVGRADGIDDIS